MTGRADPVQRGTATVLDQTRLRHTGLVEQTRRRDANPAGPAQPARTNPPAPDPESLQIAAQARVLESQGRPADAAELMCRLVQRRQYRGQPLAPQFCAAWMALTERARQSPEDNVTHFSLLAKSLSNQERYAEAIAAGARALALQPDDPLALRLRAVDLLLLGREVEAVGAARAARRLTPDDAMTQFMSGAVLLRIGHPKEAIAALDQALALAPRLRALGGADPLGYQLDMVHQMRGKALLSQHRPEEALAAFTAAVAIDPGNLGHLRLRASTLADLADTAAATAIATAREARRTSLAAARLKVAARTAQAALEASTTPARS